ncbi:unnamed protein product, partial [Rotaria sp. Silwood2]
NDLAIASNAPETNQELLGSIHNNIAGILDEQGQFDEALEHYRKGLEYMLACLLDIHPNIATSYSDLEFFYIERGQYEEGLSMLSTCLKTQKRSLPDDHPSLIATYNHITLGLAKVERYSEAFGISMKALDIDTRKLGHEHEQTCYLRTMLVMIANQIELQ